MGRQERGFNIITISATLLLFTLLIAVLYALKFGIEAFLKADPNVQASIMVGSLGLAGTLYTVHYNARRSREQLAFQEHRKIKVDLYRRFLGKLSEMIAGANSSEREESQEDLENFFNEFVWDLLLFGGPNVIRFFSEWKSRASAENLDNQEALLSLGRLIREMRNDIGETNSKIDERDILGALLEGGKTALDGIGK